MDMARSMNQGGTPGTLPVTRTEDPTTRTIDPEEKKQLKTAYIINILARTLIAFSCFNMIFMVQHMTHLYELFFYLGVVIRLFFIVVEIAVSYSDMQLRKIHLASVPKPKDESNGESDQRDTSLDSTTFQFTFYHIFKVVI